LLLDPSDGSLAIDNLLDVEVILASGEIVHANEKENPDLFWALRGRALFARISQLGAGPNFGVVTEFTFQAYDQTNEVWSGILIYTPDKIPAVVAAVEEFRKAAPASTALAVGIGCSPGTAIPTVLLSPFSNGPEAEGREVFKRFLDIGPVVEMMENRPYVKQVSSLLLHL
jgi:FAD/FMN-containing dehydrogenase